jgi:bacteriocin biosynthesis cyclodehydratase domain-containing protein
MSGTGCRYAGSREWRVTHEDGFLIASGGADELYAIEDVSGETAAELAVLWKRPSGLAELSADAQRLLPQLLNVGAVLRELASGPPSAVAVAFAGRRDHELLDALVVEAAEDRRWRLAEPGDSNLTLFVRTGGRLVETSDGIGHPLSGPHLFLDAAFHHTVSLGPLVFPGETACLACLAGRIGQYWGDAPPPERPTVQRETRLIGALAALELDKIAAGDYGLVNATVAFDLRRYEVKRHALYKLPWCPVCGDRSRGDEIGAIALPWAGAA